jgi:DivIVA domain-containing protein
MESDDAFHLTAVDVRRYEFGTVMRGYDKARVDQFRAQVADEMERLARSNQDLEEKARNFHEQLRAFRDRDRALNEALISAQELRAEMREQAAAEKALLMKEAEAEAHWIVESAREESRLLKEEIDRLERSRRAYLAQIKMFAERHIAEVTAAEGQMPMMEDRRPLK